MHAFLTENRNCNAWLVAALIVMFGTHTALATKDTRPNLLFAIADDWSWPHAGAYGDRGVKTPTFDRLAEEGVLFTHAYCASPSCTPSRGAILTGQPVHRLENGANLWSMLPAKFAVYPDLLERAGYRVGFTRKGWGPGTLEGTGRSRNPAGPRFKDFNQFFDDVPDDKPFCFWFGSVDPHRNYEKGSGLKSGMKLADASVPPFLPDTPEVRSDILDYYWEVQRFDREVGEILSRLEKAGRLDNTVVVMTSDNGMPFPRAKANVYEYGTRMPLAMRWPAGLPAGRRYDGFVSAIDFAPTFLLAAGLTPPVEMKGRDLIGAFVPCPPAARDNVFVERERHANVRKGDLGYPCRAVRTRNFLYIRNLRPDRWPAGDPVKYVDVGPFGDVDNSPTKQFILDNRDDPSIAPFFKLAFDKRPAEELYDLRADPGQRTNVAEQPHYADEKAALRASLDQWMKNTGDPRAVSDDDHFDRYPYVGGKRKPRDRK
jgi:arylsulfatase A-like enzyme